MVATVVAAYGIRDARQRAELEKLLGRDAKLTELIMRVETDSQGMSFMDLFELCDTTIKQRDGLLVELGGLSASEEIKESVDQLFSAENALTRAKCGYYRKLLTFTSAKNKLQHIDPINDLHLQTYELAMAPTKIHDVAVKISETEGRELREAAIVFAQAFQKADQAVQTIRSRKMTFISPIDGFRDANRKTWEGAAKAVAAFDKEWDTNIPY